MATPNYKQIDTACKVCSPTADTTKSTVEEREIFCKIIDNYINNLDI